MGENYLKVYIIYTFVNTTRTDKTCIHVSRSLYDVYFLAFFGHGASVSV